MDENNKIKLENELSDINKQIDDIKLNDMLDVKELKRLLNERERIEFRLWLWN